MSNTDTVNGVDNGMVEPPGGVGSGGDSGGMTPGGGKVVDVGKGTTTCEPKTCESEEAQCGTIADAQRQEGVTTEGATA